MHQRVLPLNLYQTFAYDTLNRISLFEQKASNTAPACPSGGTTPCRAYAYDNWSNQFVTQATGFRGRVSGFRGQYTQSPNSLL
jgi:hypothetical protein